MPISDSAASELAQLLNGASAGELIPELVRQGLQALIEAEAAAALGADRHERTVQRRGHRNGSRERLLATPAGDVQLRIPRFRTGSFFPSLLEPRRRVDRALWAVVMEAYVSGVSTRKVDELVAALGCESGISKSEVSRICQGLDTQVQAFLNRPLEFSRYPYVYLDATYLHGRDPARRQVISRAVIVAVGITANGQREVLGIEVGDSEDEAFWTAFLRRLRERGLSGVQLVISDAHAGLKKAIVRCCQGSSWQRCRVHFARNLLVKVPKGSQDMVAAALRSVFGVRSDRGTGRGAAVGSGHQDAQRKIPGSGSPDGAGQGGRAGVPGVPTRTLAQDLEYQPAGAAEQRDQAPHPRRRHLPQRRRNHPAGGCASAGAAGGMATRWSPRVLRTLDDQAGQHQQSDPKSKTAAITAAA